MALSYNLDRSADISDIKEVLTEAPALHSLIVCEREDAADILEFLNHIHSYLMKLVLECCYLGWDSTGLLANIVALFPDLEALSLEGCTQLRSGGYGVIANPKKLSDSASIQLRFNDCNFSARATPILHVTFWLELLVVILMMVWAGAISLSERDTAQRITELEDKNNILEDQNYILKKQLEGKEKCLNFKIETQEQMQTTIDYLRMTVETNSRTIQELREKKKIYKATIDGLRGTEEANNRTIQELCEKEKDHKEAIDDLATVFQQDIGRHLREAVRSEDVKTVKILCKYANDTCITDDESGNTPLIVAAARGHVEIVRLLLESGANTERSNKNQWTALHKAALDGHMEVCRVLLDWGAKVDAVNSRKNTPLHFTAWTGQLSVTKLLVERGAYVWARNEKGQTARDWARLGGKKDVAKWLDLQSRR